jgi:hypothetical protein
MTATIAWVGSDQQTHIKVIDDDKQAVQVIEQFEQDSPDTELAIEWTE